MRLCIIFLLSILTACSSSDGSVDTTNGSTRSTDTTAPTAVLSAFDETGLFLQNGKIAYNTNFILDGSKSFDAAGRIVSYQWTLNDGSTRTTADSRLVIDAATTPLPVGGHNFQLMVTDDSGNQSAPVSILIIVVDVTAPTAVLSAFDETGLFLQNGKIAYNTNFILDGSKSFDAAGRIVSYQWTLNDGSTRTTADSRLVIDAATTPLPVGGHNFQLMVTDDSGNQSAPVSILIIVVDNIAPHAVMQLQDAQGAIVLNNTVPSREDFILSAEASSDIAGQLARYHWTAVDMVSGEFRNGNPVVTTTPTLRVNAASDPIGVGTYVYRLVVEDDSGNLSQPVELSVQISQARPVSRELVPALDTTEGGVQIPADVPLHYAAGPYVSYTSTGAAVPSNRVAYGNDFYLVADLSNYTGGNIVRYYWTALDGSEGGIFSPNNPRTSPTGSVSSKRIVTSSPSLYLNAASDIEPVTPGRHRYRLVMEDVTGNFSAPMMISIEVVETPTLHIGAINANSDFDAHVALDTDFSLSVKVPANVTGLGNISQYIWDVIDDASGNSLYRRSSSIRDTFLLGPATGKTLSVGDYTAQLTLVDDTGKSSVFSRPFYVFDSTVPIQDNLDFDTATQVLDSRGRVAPGNRVAYARNFYLSPPPRPTATIERWHWSAIDTPTGVFRNNATVVTTTDRLLINAAEDPLPVGTHRYQLVLEDQQGNRSLPLLIYVSVVNGAEDSPLNLAADTDFSIAMWVKPNSLVQNMVLFSQETSAIDTHRFVIRAGALGEIQFSADRFGTGWDTITSGNRALGVGKWFFVTVTRSGKTVSLYVDGNLVGQGDQLTSLGANMGIGGHYIGQFGNNGDPKADALISEVSFWGRALTATEMTNLMTYRLHGTETDLLGYWPLSEANGNIAHDKTGNHHGVLENLAQWTAISPEIGQQPFQESPFLASARIGEEVVLYLSGTSDNAAPLSLRIVNTPLNARLLQYDGSPIAAGDTVTDPDGRVILVPTGFKDGNSVTAERAVTFGFVANDGANDSDILDVSVVVANTPPIAGGASRNSLLAYYPFDDATLGLVKDASGAGHDGVVAGAGAAAMPDRNGGSTAYAMAPGGYLDLGDMNVVENIDALTISAWVDFGQFTDSSTSTTRDRDRNVIVSKWISGGSSTQNSFMFSDIGPDLGETNGGTLNMLVSNADRSGAGGSVRHYLTTGQWHHVATVFDKGLQEIFIDGVSMGVRDIFYSIPANDPVGAIGRVPDSDTSLFIGSWRPDLGYPSFAGSLDEIRFYDRALSGVEIAQMAIDEGYTRVQLGPSPVTITLKGHDADGDSLGFRILSLPDNGQLFQSDGATPVNAGDRLRTGGGDTAEVVFQPSSSGLSSFRYVVNDGQVDSAIADYTLDVVSALPK